MKQIPLNKGKFALVDDEDFDTLSQKKWFVSTDGYAVRQDTKNGAHLHVRMHRVIVNAPSAMQVDHADGNRLNNQKSNLRLATKADNMRNRKMQRNNTSGYRGVFKAGSKWASAICFENRLINLGYFTDILDAARAYNEKARELFGEFARLNEVPE